jgi:myo-inositol 2-dehydrogenase/D-chiro-inositol 1-dehydrogenase
MHLKFAFVGCGGMGRTRHIPALVACENARLVAVCDRIRERADAAGAEFGVPAYYDVDTMIATEKPDVCPVITLESDRLEPILKVVGAGCHTFTEKPLFAAKGQMRVEPTDVPVAEQMVTAAKENGVFFGMGFNYRFLDHVKLMKEAIETGELGALVYVHVCAHLACWSHVLDLTRYFVGEVDELSAKEAGPADAPDRVVCLKFANGAVGTIIGTARRGWHRPLFSIEINGEAAGARIEDLAGAFVLERNDTKETRRIGAIPLHARDNFDLSFDRHMRAFVDAIAAGNEPPVTGMDGLRELQLEAAIVESAATGASVKTYVAA